MDEQQALEALKKAPDYEQGLARLDDKQRGLMKRLYKAAGDLSKAAREKQKHMSSISLFLVLEPTNRSVTIHPHFSHPYPLSHQHHSI